MPQTVGSTGSFVTIEARFCSSRMVLKSSRCHLGKIRSVGSGRRRGWPAVAEVGDDFLGVFRPSMHAGRASFEVAQRASRHGAYSCNIRGYSWIFPAVMSEMFRFPRKGIK